MTIAPLALDVTVVGAGQAGLVIGYFLKRAGLDVRLFDRARQVGDSWRRRYDSLVLFSPRSYSALPGLPMDGDPEGYPTKDEAASYLEQYARTFALPVTLNDGVARLDREEDWFVAVTTRRRRIVSRAVVVATGAFQKTRVPGFASSLSRVAQLCVEQFRNPHQLPDGRVLVVGGGAAGRQIALELARSHRVSLSLGSQRAPTRLASGRRHTCVRAFDSPLKQTAIRRLAVRSDGAAHRLRAVPLRDRRQPARWRAALVCLCRAPGEFGNRGSTPDASEARVEDVAR